MGITKPLFNLKKQKISMGNVMLCLVGIGLIVCLQPMHNYLKQNPEALDQSYAASQFAQSQTLNLSLKKNEAIKQSFLTKIRFQNVTFNLLNNENGIIDIPYEQIDFTNTAIVNDKLFLRSIIYCAIISS